MAGIYLLLRAFLAKIRQHRWQAISQITIDVIVLFVCLPVTFVHYAETAEAIDTIAFA